MVGSATQKFVVVYVAVFGLTKTAIYTTTLPFVVFVCDVDVKRNFV